MARTRIAQLLIQNRSYLTDLWGSAVRQDPRIVSDDVLTPGELRNEVPAVIGEMAEALAAGEPPSVTTAREGRVHVYTRYRQGYRARDVVRELSLLRLVVLDYLTAMATEPELDLSVGEYAEAARILGLFIDEEMRYAITIYTESEPGPRSGEGA
jgi:hypothetical protein